MAARAGRKENPVAITVEDVSMTYGTGAAAVPAVRAVSLEARRGEVLLLMGPSGSGKTTLLQIIGGLLQPTQGAVVFEGQRLGDLDRAALAAFRLKRLGFVFQAYNLISTLRAWENVAIAHELQGRTGRDSEAKSRALLDYVGLGHRADAFPDAMSGGEKQRVAIARAVAGDPEVILADEPTAALDAASGARVAELLKTFASRYDRAVVVVTHDPRLTAIGDRIATLEDGKILSLIEEPTRRRHASLSASLLTRASA
jgi:putative ABC transport system ATP-binding protein